MHSEAGTATSPRGLMPVLRPTEDGADAWWTAPRRAPFDARDVAAWHPWPGEVAAVVLCRAMRAECEAHRCPFTATLERLFAMHDLHPSEGVRALAGGILSDFGAIDVFEEEDDGSF